MRNRLLELSDLVEEHGAAAISSSANGYFTVSQAETYKRYYEGLKRMEQWESIKGKLISMDSPFYGWGPLVYHKPIVVYDETVPEVDPSAPLEEQARIRAIRRECPARLEVYKKREAQPTIGMWLIRALLSPVIVPDFSIEKLRTRRNRLARQVKDPEQIERLYKLSFRQMTKGVWVGTESYNIQPIVDKSD